MVAVKTGQALVGAGLTLGVPDSARVFLCVFSKDALFSVSTVSLPTSSLDPGQVQSSVRYTDPPPRIPVYQFVA
jgi:hypothetical protein